MLSFPFVAFAQLFLPQVRLAAETGLQNDTQSDRESEDHEEWHEEPSPGGTPPSHEVDGSGEVPDFDFESNPPEPAAVSDSDEDGEDLWESSDEDDVEDRGNGGEQQRPNPGVVIGPKLFCQRQLELPLYPGSDLSLKQVILLLVNAATKNRLSLTALEDLLVMNSAIFPKPNILPTSVYQLYQLLGINVNDFERHVCTNDCTLFPVRARQDYDVNELCPTCGEKRFLPVGACLQPRKKFYVIPLAWQVELLKKRGLLDNSMGMMRTEIEEGTATDPNNSFWGGHIASKFLGEPGFLPAFTQRLVLSLGTDGVNCFKKGKYEVWPIGVKIWNLHPTTRTARQSILLSSLIPGPSAPKTFDAYFTPVLTEILNSKNGKFHFWLVFFFSLFFFSSSFLLILHLLLHTSPCRNPNLP